MSVDFLMEKHKRDVATNFHRNPLEFQRISDWGSRVNVNTTIFVGLYL